MRKFFPAIALLLVFGLSAPVLAGPFEDGLMAYYTDDYATAMRLFRPLADQGDASAQNILGRMYVKGQGVPQDYAAAVKWYRLAADHGDAVAQFNLGFMYENGQGVPQDYVQAHKWSNLSAAGASTDEKNVRDLAVKNRDMVAAKMTPAQIAEAQKLASAWKSK